MENSQNFPAYYTVLCARTADAIDAIDQQRYQEARALLIAGMQEAMSPAVLETAATSSKDLLWT